MKPIIIAILTLTVLCSCQTGTHEVSDQKSNWHPYGHLEFYRNLRDPELFSIMGATSKSSGITILDPKRYKAVEVEVVDLSDSDFSYLGMFKLEVDDTPMVPSQKELQSARDKHYVKPGVGKVTYALPPVYEKIVINFNFGTFRGYRFRLKLIE